MSWLCLVVFLLWILTAWRGFRRGLVRTAISMVSFILILLMVSAISPVVNQLLVERTTIRETIQKQCSESLSSVISGSDEANTERNNQVSIIENLPLPQSLKDQLLENNNSVIYNLLSVDTFADYIATYLASLIVQALAYIISFIIASIILRIIMHFLDLFANLPILGGINRIGGLLLGIIVGLLDLWIFFVIVTIFSSTDIGAYLMKEIASDHILSYLYDNNMLMQFLTSLITK